MISIFQLHWRLQIYIWSAGWLVSEFSSTSWSLRNRRKSCRMYNFPFCQVWPFFKHNRSIKLYNKVRSGSPGAKFCSSDKFLIKTRHFVISCVTRSSLQFNVGPLSLPYKYNHGNYGKIDWFYSFRPDTRSFHKEPNFPIKRQISSFL